MDESNVINLGLLLLTGIGLALTAWQALDARKARDEAQRSSEKAGEQAQISASAASRSADASELALEHQARSAAALEKQVELAENATKQVPEWVFKAMSPATMDQRWMVTNNTGEDALYVSIGTPAGLKESWIKPEGDSHEKVAQGESIYFTFIRRFSSPTSAIIWIFWTPADGSPQRQFTTTIS